jgi:hypothetical protein
VRRGAQYHRRSQHRWIRMRSSSGLTGRWDTVAFPHFEGISEAVSHENVLTLSSFRLKLIFTSKLFEIYKGSGHSTMSMQNGGQIISCMTTIKR